MHVLETHLAHNEMHVLRPAYEDELVTNTMAFI